MLSRRTFLSMSVSLAASAMAGPSYAQQPSAAKGENLKRMAVVTTLWNYHSHAWHMAERFLHGYPCEGNWHRPPIQVVSAYVDQQPSGDLSRRRSEEFGFPIYPTVGEALRCGGERLAV